VGLRKGLAAVLTAAYKVTGTYGDVGDRQKVMDYLKDPVSSDFKIYAYVYKIPFGTSTPTRSRPSTRIPSGRRSKTKAAASRSHSLPSGESRRPRVTWPYGLTINDRPH
jgi:hypothetical protein